MSGLSVNNILAQHHKLMPFAGAWRASFGTPSATGVWTIQGRSGCGKTTFALMLTNYLRSEMHKKVIYWSIEQCGDYGFQRAIQRANFETTAGIRFFGNEPDAMEQVIELMEMKRGYDVLIIDSLTALHHNSANGFTQRQYNSLVKRLHNKLVIFICHEKDGRDQLETPAGNYIKQQANIKVSVVGFVCYVNARAGFSAEEGGGANFIINQEKANEYSLNNI